MTREEKALKRAEELIERTAVGRFRETIAAELLAVERETAEKIGRMAMDRCRELNGNATYSNRHGNYEAARVAELKADQFEWMETAIQREFGLDVMPLPEGPEVRG